MHCQNLPLKLKANFNYESEVIDSIADLKVQYNNKERNITSIEIKGYKKFPILT